MECESDTVINATDIHAQPVDTSTEGWGIGVKKGIGNGLESLKLIWLPVEQLI